MRKLKAFAIALMPLLMASMCGLPQSESTATNREICRPFKLATHATPDDGFLPSRKDTEITADWVTKEQANNKLGRELYIAACTKLKQNA